MADVANFTFEMDESLRAALRHPQFRDAAGSKRSKLWDSIAKLIPGDVSAKACINRWQHIQSLPGLEYGSLFESEKIVDAPVRTRTHSGTDDTSGSDRERVTIDEEPSDDTEDDLIKAQSGNIVIHVCDDQRKINRDFTCDKHELLRGMGYFRDYIKAETPTEDIDISVHCDVTVFEWLVNWLHSKHSRPEMNPMMVVSVLISGHFLRMPPLVEECLDYIARHLSEVIALPIDLSCINEELVARLAERVGLPELERAVDRKDKLLSRLYNHKAHQLLLDDTVLFKCAFCSRMFTADQREWMVCTKAKIFIDFHGNVLAQHVQDRSFDRNAFLEALHVKRRMSWKDVFWRVWAMLQSLRCVTCGQQFVLTDLGHCTYHPLAAVFAEGENTGTHQCCGAQVARFSTSHSKERGGCEAQEHRVMADSPEADLIVAVKRHAQAALTPFDRRAQHDIPSHIDPDTLLTARTGPPTLRVEQSSSDDGDSDATGSATDASDVNSDMTDRSGTTDASDDSDSDSDSATRRRQAPRFLSARSRQSQQRRDRPRSGQGTNRRKLSPRSERHWKENNLREDDLARMHAIITSLVASREVVKNEKIDKYPGGTGAKVEQRLKSNILASKGIKHAVPAKFSRV